MFKNNKIKICLHIGLHKTGSTFLQDKIFCNIKNIQYLGRDNSGVWHTENRDIFLKDIVHLDFKKFEYKYKNLDIVSFLDINIEKINLLSEEKFSSLFYSSENLDELFKRIKFIFKESIFDLKILYFIRNQKDIILSRYSENSLLFNKYNSSIKKFSDISKEISKDSNTFSRDIFVNWKYFYFKKKLKEIISYSKIRFIIYEEFITHKQRTISEIFEFFEIKEDINLNNSDVNKTYKIINYNEDKIFLGKVYTFLEKYLGRKLLNKFNQKHSYTKKMIKFFFIILSIFKNPIKRNSIYDDKITAYYSEDNKNFEAYFNLNLKKFDYY